MAQNLLNPIQLTINSPLTAHNDKVTEGVGQIFTYHSAKIVSWVPLLAPNLKIGPHITLLGHNALLLEIALL